MNDSRRRLMIVAGGTGGHIYPALAVAECLREHDIETIWLGSRVGLENRIVPAAGIELFTISVAGLRGKGVLRWLAAPFVLTYAIAQTIAVMRREQPRVVVGMGGFASGPGGLVAKLLRRPLLIHEQNAIPGLTNRLLSRIANRVFEAFPGAFRQALRAETVGNPVRSAILALPEPAARNIGQSPIHILVLGGSRGARALNESTAAALALCHGNVVVRHQCGEGHATSTIAAYAAAGVDAQVDEFIDDMASAYARASLVICRSGALTVSEISAAGIASILVPFPFAVDDHQTANARYLTDSDAAILVAEGPEFAARLGEAMQASISDPGRLLKMAQNARRLAKVDAAERVAATCAELFDA